MWSRSLLATAVVAATISSTVATKLAVRNDYPAQPPCTQPYTPFVSVGCYTDPSVPNRALDYSPQLPSANMTIELCTASCKSNGFRYAGLEYYFQCFCGDSIYGASADPSNCNLACTGDSTEVCGGNDFVSIYADPTFPALDNTTISDYTGAGCYSEGTAGRAIQFQQTVNKATMTTESCLQQCKNEGYPLAATEYGQECYCGVVIGNGSLPVSSSNCNIPCNGNSNEICGGSSYLNLYVAIDLEEASPCAPTTPATTLPPTTTATSTTTSSTLTTTSSTSTTTTTSATSSATSSTSTTSTTATPTSTTSSTTSTSTVTSSSTASSTSSSTTSSTISKTTTSTPMTTSTISSTTSSTSTTTTSTSKATTTTTTTTSTAPTTMMTSTKTTSTSSSSKCQSTAPAPTCEYGCGSWCSKPIPWFSNTALCVQAAAACKLQIADCLTSAGWPAALQCLEFAGWCEGVEQYCSKTPSSKCSKSDCFSQNPPQNGPSTTAGICTPSATSTTAPSATTSVCPPTATNICILPTGSSNSGYSGGSCVGGIEPPFVTCNNIKSDWQEHPFKCYTSQQSSNCPSYPRNQLSTACQQACNVQYNNCMNVYANSCKSNSNNNSWSWRKRTTGDTYSSASNKCQNQKNDCYNANNNIYVSSSRCSNFNSGWN